MYFLQQYNFWNNDFKNKRWHQLGYHQPLMTWQAHHHIPRWSHTIAIQRHRDQAPSRYRSSTIALSIKHHHAIDQAPPKAINLAPLRSIEHHSDQSNTITRDQAPSQLSTIASDRAPWKVIKHHHNQPSRGINRRLPPPLHPLRMHAIKYCSSSASSQATKATLNRVYVIPQNTP